MVMQESAVAPSMPNATGDRSGRRREARSTRQAGNRRMEPWKGDRKPIRWNDSCRPCRGFHPFSAQPGAARFALAPGYSLPALRAWVPDSAVDPTANLDKSDFMPALRAWALDSVVDPTANLDKPELR